MDSLLELLCDVDDLYKGFLNFWTNTFCGAARNSGSDPVY